MTEQKFEFLQGLALLKSLNDSIIGKIMVVIDDHIIDVINSALFPKAHDQEYLEDSVSENFILRRIMWEDLYHEQPDYVLESADDLSKTLAKTRSNISSRFDDHAKFLNSVLKLWENEAALLMKDIRDYRSDDKGALHSDEILAPDRTRDRLRTFRLKTLPAAEAIILLLQEASPIRSQALELLSKAKHELKVRFDEVPAPALRLELKSD